MQFAEMNLIVAERFTLFYNKQRIHIRWKFFVLFFLLLS